jgi:hypothetical protein
LEDVVPDRPLRTEVLAVPHPDRSANAVQFHELQVAK